MTPLFRYLMQYRIGDMIELARNEKKLPAPCEARLDGKTAVVTGSTSGIGLETAHLFASIGANLVLCNRNAEKSRLLEKELADRYGCRVRSILADFSSLAGAKGCARSLLALEEPIDLLVHNSGVYYKKRTFTADGIEMVFQVNHLSSFCITWLLKERLREENRARIVYVNSEGHRFALAGVHLDDLEWRRHLYGGLKSYGAAKTAQLLTIARFAQYFEGTAVTVNAMHPGNVRTAIGDNNDRLYRFMKKKIVLSSARDPVISAEALRFLCADPSLSHTSGRFYNLTTEEKPAPHARDARMVEPVWNKSLELCGLS